MAAGHEGDGIGPPIPIPGQLIAGLIIKGKTSISKTKISPVDFGKTKPLQQNWKIRN